MKNSWTVVGIGELLWDIFPTNKHIGGAPVNFAYHCSQLGATAYPVSCVGKDKLGKEIRDALTALAVSQHFISEDAAHPTGTVEVRLDGSGKPSYEIYENVAWDAIPMTPELQELAVKTDAVCFGSLAQRGERSRATIHAFLEAMRTDAIRIFDVNLRQAFFSKAIIEASLTHANVLKLSDEELPILAEMFHVAGSVEVQLRSLIERFGLQFVAYTLGPDGSLLMTADDMDSHPGCPENAVDTVGAGDSFTAALCVGLLHKHSLTDINAHANRVATFVCSHEGATPILAETLKTELFLKQLEIDNEANRAT